MDKKKKHFFFTDHKFASAGREDIDVRMLGSGKLAVYPNKRQHTIRLKILKQNYLVKSQSNTPCML